MYTRFKFLYDKAFDNEGNVRACGREVCQELILLANQIARDVSHGNPYTGMMDIDSLKSLRQKMR